MRHGREQLPCYLIGESQAQLAQTRWPNVDVVLLRLHAWVLDCSQVSIEAHCDTLAGPNTGSIVSSECETDHAAFSRSIACSGRMALSPGSLS